SGGAVELEAGAGERHLGTGRRLEVAAGDVGVGVVQLGDHLADHVVDVRTMAGVGEQRLVLPAQRLPVVAGHALDVEEVAVPAPRLAEDLRPFLGGNAVHHQAAGVDGLFRVPAGGGGVVEIEL